MSSHDYRTLKKAKQNINFIKMSLVKNLNLASEAGRTTPKKIFFLIFSNVFVDKRKLSKESALTDLNDTRKRFESLQKFAYAKTLSRAAFFFRDTKLS